MRYDETLMWREIQETERVLLAAAGQNGEVIDRFIKQAGEKKPSSVVFAARGTSDHAATFAKYLIEIYLGLPVSLASPSVYTIYDGALSLGSSAVIGLSQSGQAADAIEVLSRARAGSALTLSVTNNPLSPMAKETEFHLDCAAGEEKSVAATKTFSAQIFLTSLLTAKWSGNPALLDAVARVPSLVRETAALAPLYAETADRYRFASDGFVLARGFSYPLALEAALKLQETSYLRVRGYATSDFRHGPIAQISANTPVVLLAVDPLTLSDAEDILDRIRAAGGDVLAITPFPEFAKKADASLLLPRDASGVAGVFAAAVALQSFACALSAGRGLDPDSPRALSKVTITR